MTLGKCVYIHNTLEMLIHRKEYFRNGTICVRIPGNGNNLSNWLREAKRKRLNRWPVNIIVTYKSLIISIMKEKRYVLASEEPLSLRIFKTYKSFFCKLLRRRLRNKRSSCTYLAEWITTGMPRPRAFPYNCRGLKCLPN